MRAIVRPAIWTLLAATLVVPPARAYPISPVPLWELIEKSDRIVVAEVTGVREAETQDNPFSSSVASLDVRETWKGEPTGALEVVFGANVTCPAPPRYVEKKTVVAFLTQFEGSWYTVGLSYGTLYPADSELEELRVMVGRARAVIEGGLGAREKIDWLVDAAAFPGTRWHGLYELLPSADSLHSYYDRGGRRGEADVLRKEQLERIAAGFVAVPSTDRTLPMALAVLSSHRSDAVSEAAVAAIEALVAQDQVPWWIPEAFVAVFVRYGDPNPKARVAALGDDYEERDIKRVREVWEKAKAELGIRKVAPAPLRRTEIWGTGGNTPS